MSHDSKTPPADSPPSSEEAKLIAFFQGEGYGDFGFDGDVRGWSPAETAIHAMSPYAAPLRSIHRDQINTVFVDADGGALFDGAQPDIGKIGRELREIVSAAGEGIRA